MNHLTRIFTMAGQLQASRSFLRDLRGLDKTPEGIAFAKALTDGAAEGVTPMEVVEEVVKAMGGDEGKALEILGAVEEIAKGMVGQHTRTLANGKTVNVKAYENARTAAMKQTTLAHGATFHAMRTKTAEGHENAAASHEEAAKQHGEAHAVHPMDVPEVGEEHAKLKASHLNAVAYHRSEANSLRGEEKYNRAKTKAETSTRTAGEAYDSHSKVAAHQAAATAHAKAAEAKPGAGHEEQAEGHEIQAQAHEASFKAGMGPLPYPTVKRAAMASGEAEKATTQAVKTGTKGDHGKAAALHAHAIDHHMSLHGAHEDSEDGHHGQMAMRHMELHAFHAKKAQEAEGAKVETQTVAKGEGCMTSLGGGTDIATKTGGAALAVEGHPDEKDRKKDEDDEEEIGKSHVEGHTRTVNGKVVQVAAYDFNRMWTHHGEVMNHQSSHPRAATATDNALAASEEAHGNEELGVEKNDQHAYAAHMHLEAAQEHDHAAAASTDDALRLHHATAAMGHHSFADEHTRIQRSMEKPDAGDHATMAMEKVVGLNLHGNGTARQASEHAHSQTIRAGEKNTPLSHARAFNAHRAAANAHRDRAKDHTNRMDIMPEVIEAHHAIARHHEDAATAHLEEVRALKDAATPGVEGQDFGKSEVAAHTRTQGGRVVQVSAYESKRASATRASEAARAGDVDHDKVGYGPGSEKKYLESARLHRHAALMHKAAARAQVDDMTANRNTDHTAAHIQHDGRADAHEGNATESRRLRIPAPERNARATSYPAQKAAAEAQSSAAHVLTGKVRSGGGKQEDIQAAYEAHRKASDMHNTLANNGPVEFSRGHAETRNLHFQVAERFRPKGQTVAKAHVEQHTRVVGGKTVQVSGYDTHMNAANAISKNATMATSHSISKGHEEHAAAADLHKQAAEAHRTAAQHAPEAWQQRGHEDQANLHGHYASSHAKKAAELAPAARAKKTPIVTELPNGMRHTEGEDSTGQPIHSVSSGGAILGHGKTREEAMEMADRETKAHQEGKASAATPDDHTRAADKASRETSAHARGEAGYEDAHGKAALLHEKAGEAHLQAHAEGNGSEHYHAASRHFGMSVDHAKENTGNQGTYEHATKIAGHLSEHADAHKLEDNYQSHDQHAAKHLLAIEAHGKAREAATKMGTTAHANQYPADHHFLKADAHRTKIEHHRAEMAKGHDEINLRAKRAESASRTTLAPAGGAKVHEEAAAAHRHAAAIQYDSEVRGQHETKAAYHDGQVAAMQARTPPETHHDRALAAAKGTKGRTGKQMLPYSQTAHAASVKAEQTGTKEDHHAAEMSHMAAEMSHEQANEDTDYKHEGHQKAWEAHHAAASYHRAKAQG
jgi:hypothetical protein